jgi:hypothetical protein
MPYEIDYNDRIFTVTFSGAISIRDITNANTEIYESKNFDIHKGQVFDFSNADLSLLEEKDTTTPAAYDLGASNTNINVRVASVATEEHAINICKMYANTSKECNSPWSFNICPTVAEAKKWIVSNKEGT